MLLGEQIFFWNVTLFSLVDCNQCFSGTCSLCIQNGDISQ